MNTSPSQIPPTLKASLFCAISPMLAGLLIPLGATTSTPHSLAFMGLFLIFLSIPVNLMGFILLGIFRWKSRKDQPTLSRWKNWTRLCFWLLLLSYPMAAFYAVISMR